MWPCHVEFAVGGAGHPGENRQRRRPKPRSVGRVLFVTHPREGQRAEDGRRLAETGELPGVLAWIIRLTDLGSEDL